MSKRYWWLALSLGAALGLADDARAQALNDPGAFRTAVEAVRTASQATDKFAEPPALAIEGRTFRLVIPATDGSEGQGSVIYDYKDGQLILDVSPRQLWPTMAGPSEALPAFIVTSNTKNLGSYVGQNAFGATAEVTSFRNIGAAIALVSAPKAMLSPMRTRIGAALLDDSDWWVRLPLAPGEARAVATDTVGIIEGSYRRLPSGGAGACHAGGSSATIDHPTSYTSEVCYIGARVTRIALVRKSSGEVIREWTLENSPRLGATLWDRVRVGMSMQELRAAYPALTSYGYLQAEGAQITLAKNVAAAVEVRNWPAKGKRLAQLLTARYGAPVEIDCGYDSICEGKWQAGEGVAAYLSIMGWVTYQPVDAAPPAGYTSHHR